MNRRAVGRGEGKKLVTVITRDNEKKKCRQTRNILVEHLLLGWLAHPTTTVELEEALEEHLLGALVA